MAVCECFYPQPINIKWLSAIGLKISNVYGYGLAMLGSLVMFTVYTNKFAFGQVKLRSIINNVCAWDIKYNSTV